MKLLHFLWRYFTYYEDILHFIKVNYFLWRYFIKYFAFYKGTSYEAQYTLAQWSITPLIFNPLLLKRYPSKTRTRLTNPLPQSVGDQTASFVSLILDWGLIAMDASRCGAAAQKDNLRKERSCNRSSLRCNQGPSKL